MSSGHTVATDEYTPLWRLFDSPQVDDIAAPTISIPRQRSSPAIEDIDEPSVAISSDSVGALEGPAEAAESGATRLLPGTPGIVATVTGLLVAVVSGAVVLLVLSSSSLAAWHAQVHAAVAPLSSDNRAIDRAFTRFGRTSNPVPAANAITLAEQDTASAVQSLPAIDGSTSSNDREIVTDANAALVGERALLRAMYAALLNPSSPQAAQLGLLHAHAQAEWGAFKAVVPGLHERLPSVAALLHRDRTEHS